MTLILVSFCFNDTATTEIYTLSLHDALPISVPRPETESVVQLVIEHVKDMAHPRIVDLGTGSGAIAGSIAHEVLGAEVHAVEFSPFAHAWAAKNLGPLGVHL